MMLRWIAMISLAVSTTGCLFGGDDSDDGVAAESRTVAGEVVDFQAGVAVSTAASVTTSGLSPAPHVEVEGARFTITGVPENSAFQILAGVPPTHRQTFSEAVVVATDDIAGARVPVVSEAFLGMLATSFQVTPTAARGVLLAQVVDGNGAPKAGVGKADFVLAGGGNGPFFLDAGLAPAPNLTATSASGWVVFFEVDPGVVALGQPAAPTVTLEMATSPVNAGAVTVAKVHATDGAPKLPTNVSFAKQVFPIFSTRGCKACHSGNGPGRDLGGLTLDGSTKLVYRELVMEDPTRVRVTTPEMSLVLRMPSREDPPDAHPNVTFASSLDPDYLTILVWIREGAKEN